MTAPKHLLLEVPDYDHSGGGGKAPRTYLQLGAPPSDGTPTSRGDDLLDRIGLTENVTHYFKDDFRHRNGQQHPATRYWRDDGHAISESDPVSLTKELRTRGGWRLHTDGNYLSTTRGDRIDVIGGNYKMVILGRLDVPEQWGESYYESSGGHNRDATNTPGETIMVAWNPATQTWRTVEETIKGDVVAHYQGIVREFFECDLMLSFMGSADEGAPIPVSGGEGAHTHTDFTHAWIHGPPPRAKKNPDVTETVRALTIRELTKVETVGGTSVATDTDQIVHPVADRTITSLASYRQKNESMAATSIEETVTVESGVVIDERVGGAAPAESILSGAERVPTFRDTLVAGAVLSVATYRDKTVENTGDLTSTLNVHGLKIELGTAFTFDQVLADFGRHEVSATVTGVALGASISGSLDVTLGLKTAFTQVNEDSQGPETPVKWDKVLFNWRFYLVWRQYIAASKQTVVTRLFRTTLLTTT